MDVFCQPKSYRLYQNLLLSPESDARRSSSEEVEGVMGHAEAVDIHHDKAGCSPVLSGKSQASRIENGELLVGIVQIRAVGVAEHRHIAVP